jgi:hypothetical protein
VTAQALLLSLLALGSSGHVGDSFHLIIDDVHVRFTGPSTAELPKTTWRDHLFVVIDNDPLPPQDYPGQFPEDFFRLAASLESSPLASQCAAVRFESTYGEFELVLADLTGDGLEEFILARGDGRGTAARTERLDVYRLGEKGLVPIFEHQLSDRPGIDCRWSYLVSIQPVGAGEKPLLHLALFPDHEYCPPMSLPRAQQKTYEYDPHLDRLVLKQWSPDGR